jgi:anti-sigma factor RsiW
MRMDCKHFAKHLHACVDNAVAPAIRAAMQAHAVSCPACRREFESLAQLEAVLRSAPQPPPVPAGFAGRVMARAAAARNARAPFRLVARLPGFDWWEDLARPARAAAAAVLVAGLAMGAVMGWDANRNGRSPSAVATQPDALAAYNLDYLAEAPAGSLAQVVMALDQ